jgi:hypothetical protein
MQSFDARVNDISTYSINMHVPNFLKACLHLQFLLRLQVRFSSSDGCERVDKL